MAVATCLLLEGLDALRQKRDLTDREEGLEAVLHELCFRGQLRWYGKQIEATYCSGLLEKLSDDELWRRAGALADTKQMFEVLRARDEWRGPA